MLSKIALVGCVWGVWGCVCGGEEGGEITRLTCPPKGIAGASCTYALRERMRRGICLEMRGIIMYLLITSFDYVSHWLNYY